MGVRDTSVFLIVCRISQHGVYWHLALSPFLPPTIATTNIRIQYITKCNLQYICILNSHYKTLPPQHHMATIIFTTITYGVLLFTSLLEPPSADLFDFSKGTNSFSYMQYNKLILYFKIKPCLLKYISIANMFYGYAIFSRLK